MVGNSSEDNEREMLEVRVRELVTRLEFLRAPPSPPEKRSLWQKFVAFLAATSLGTAAVGGAVTIWTKDDQRCVTAHEAIRDDNLNEALNPREERLYILEQMRIARECDRQD